MKLYSASLKLVEVVELASTNARTRGLSWAAQGRLFRSRPLSKRFRRGRSPTRVTGAGGRDCYPYW